MIPRHLSMAPCKIRDAEKAAGSLHAASSFAHCYATRAVASTTPSSHVFEKARFGFEPQTLRHHGIGRSDQLS